MKKLLLIPAICVLFTACGDDSVSNDDNSGKMTQSKEQSNSADWELTLKVKEAILLDDDLSPSNRFVSVTTTDGIVVLTGNVSSKKQMKKIVKKAEQVPGVKSVDNQLTISND